MASEAQLLKRVRKICLALPGGVEKEAWGAPTFRAKDRMFASFAAYHHGVDWIAVWLSTPPGMQQSLVAADPDRFFVPPYVGKRGWTGVRLDGEVDWDALAEIVEQSYRAVASKRLVEELDDP